ncbi:hypothetical protein Tco_0746104 [Tanacetum coccineum]
MSRDHWRSVRGLVVSIAELRDLGDCDDGDVTLRLLERLRLDNVEKAICLRLMMKETDFEYCGTVDDFRTEREKQKKNTTHSALLLSDLGCSDSLERHCASVEPRDMQLFVAIWVAAEDRRFAMRMNFLREEIADVCKYRRNLINELCSVRSVIAPVKAAELLNDSLTKDEVKMAQLLELERQLELRALKKELFTQKLVRNVPF